MAKEIDSVALLLLKATIKRVERLEMQLEILLEDMVKSERKKKPKRIYE